MMTFRLAARAALIAAVLTDAGALSLTAGTTAPDNPISLTLRMANSAPSLYLVPAIFTVTA
jgi:hypothetical protein